MLVVVRSVSSVCLTKIGSGSGEMGLFAGEAAVLLSTGRTPSLPDNCPKWGRWRRVGRVPVRFSPPPPKARGVVAAAGRRIVVEKLWRELFSDPSQWWDNRLEKVKCVLFLFCKAFCFCLH